ncbi:hypothetical protein CHS0354_020155 [Potamilus streckersoni]|uniref:alpha-1,2-Mannosidase n=1 Tax=Potamilus streckersoni TaxID=2493646 RepID=A0AAE0VQG3_9BIVA|nr:hypothetical protein CHS0354_020155 [Potamilus streckersoni]
MVQLSKRVNILLIILIFPYLDGVLSMHKNLSHYRERVAKMFQHAYDGYIHNAYPYDELRPITCDGHDTWGSYSLTLIDALDTLIIMGNHTEFRRVAQLLIDRLDFSMDINASVFETNIRVVGGLLSAHLLSKRAGMELEEGWPCSGPLLRMAETVARRLLPAFDTMTGMPYGTVNLKHGVPPGETTITCTAGVGTFVLEFGALSRLTSDPIFEKVAIRALRALWNARSSLNLVGNHVDINTGKWTALDAGIGGGVDSYFEYLVKGSILFQSPELLQMFRAYEAAVEKYLKRDDWYMWAHMSKGTITLPVFTSLDAYYPGIQALLGDIDKGMKTIHNFHQVWKQYGFIPEFYNIVKNEAYQGREGYPLRPELVEGAMYLYQATRDPYLLQIGVDMLESIEHSTKTKCGYATVKDVRTHRLENRMESFFLAETTKYLYLLFDPDNFIHSNGGSGTVIQTPNGECIIDAGGYIFNTEAHPFDMASLHCCGSQKKQEDAELQDFHDNFDLLSILDIVERTDTDTVEGVRWLKSRKNQDAGKGARGVDIEVDKYGTTVDQNVENDVYITLDETISKLDKEINTTIAESNIKTEIDNYAEVELKSVEEIKTDITKKSDDLKVESKVLSVPETSSHVDSESSVEDDSKSSSHGSLSIQEKTEFIDEKVKDVDNELDDEDKEADDIDDSERQSPLSVTVQTPEMFHGTQRYSASEEAMNTLFEPGINSVLKLLSSFTPNIMQPKGTSPNMRTLVDKLMFYDTFQISNPLLMTCPAQPFHMQLSVMGEMFLDHK